VNCILKISLLFVAVFLSIACGNTFDEGGSSSASAPVSAPKNFPDADGDGMRDEAEDKYGYDKNDPVSKPVFAQGKSNVELLDDETGLSVELKDLSVLFTCSKDYSFSTGRPTTFNYETYSNINSSTEYTVKVYRTTQKGVVYFHDSPELANMDTPKLVYKFDDERVTNTEFKNVNTISFNTSELPDGEFPHLDEFLARLSPIMHKYMGNPAATFTMSVKTGSVFEGAAGTSSASGRVVTLSESAEFYSAGLLVHEIAHGWRGGYGFRISGFEEAYASACVQDILKEYAWAYPSDPHNFTHLYAANRYKTISNIPHWRDPSSYYDLIKHSRFTQGGFLFADPDNAGFRYAIASTLFQYILVEEPDFYRILNERYLDYLYNGGSFSKSALVNIITSIVPKVNNKDISWLFDSTPTFSESSLDGFYVIKSDSNDLSGFELYGGYAVGNYSGFSSSVYPDDLHTLPGWVSFSYEGWDYSVNFRPTDVRYNLTSLDGAKLFSVSDTAGIYTPALATDHGGTQLARLNVTFDAYTQYTANASEGFYQFINLTPPDSAFDTYYITIGFDGAPAGSTVTIETAGVTLTQQIQGDAVQFGTTDIPYDYRGKMKITVVSPDGLVNTYWRTVLHSEIVYHMNKVFVIVDKDWNGVEDEVEF